MHLLLALIFFLVSFWLPSPGHAQQVMDRLVAAIEGEPITFSDIAKYARAKDPQFTDAQLNNSDTLKKYLEDYIGETLLAKEAQALGLVIKDEEIDSYVGMVKKQNNLSDNELKAALRDKGIAADNYRDEIKKELLKSRIVGTVIRKSVTITEGDIDRYFAEHSEIKAPEGAVHIVQLQFPDASAAQAVHDSLGSDSKLKDFTAGVYKDLGYVRVEDLREEFQQALEDLDAGDISNVVEIETKAYILQILSPADAGITQDKEMRDKVRDELYESQVKEKLAKYITEELPKKYTIENFVR